MELHDYVAIVRRYQLLLWGIVIVSTIVVGTYTAQQTERHEGSLMLYVTQATQPVSATSYQYDNYYTLEGAGLYADQVKAHFVDPGFVAKVFARANEGLPDVRLSRLAQVFVSKKFDPAAVQVTYDDVDANRVTNVLKAAATELTLETQSLQSNGVARSLNITNSDPYVRAYKPSVLVSSVIAAIVSACASLALIFLIEFSRPRK